MKNTVLRTAVCLLQLALTAGAASAQLTEKKSVSLEGARALAAVAVAEAKKSNAGAAIAVVDDGGNLLYLERFQTFAAAANLSIAKARSAANFQRDTRIFEDAIRNGRVSLVANPELLPLQGGVPIVVDGQVVGAIGVSGATSAQHDEEIAKAAVLAFSRKSANDPLVTYLPAAQVSQAFARGKPLLETEGYKVHASRREGAGVAEVHLRDTDIIYVLKGSATLVTGGEVVDSKTIAPDEIRGASTRGGMPQRLTEGDVFVVPNGVPHWFTEVQAPFLYYVVKATAPAGGAR